MPSSLLFSFEQTSEKVGSNAVSVSRAADDMEVDTRLSECTIPDYKINAFLAFSIRIDDKNIRKILCSKHAFRLSRMDAIYVSNQGKLLAFSNTDRDLGRENTFILVDTTVNGYLPANAMLGAPYCGLLGSIGIISKSVVRDMFMSTGYDRISGELSTELSRYIWPDQDAIHVQFTSPIPYFHPNRSKLNVVFGKNKDANDDKYCLTACSDGTVKLLPESECRDGNQVWTVYLFDPPSSEGRVHFAQRLSRISENAQNNYVINNNIGGNMNQSTGSQVIGDIIIGLRN